MWDPGQYLRYSGERSRPFFDLVGRIRADRPAAVYDLGCGPGHLTAALADRWPGAHVHGIDSDPAMIESARQLLAGRPAGRGGGRLSFGPGDVRDWRPAGPADVIVSNAVLQWVPGHLELLPRWAGWLADGGTLAFQLPGNFGQPSHAALREMAAAARWRPLLAGVELNRQSAGPGRYADLLSRAGCQVDAWETTYLRILPGDDPVLDWYSGTGLRPVLAALDAGQAEEFLAEFGARMRAAYPRAPYGTPFPFRRVFVVARRP
jgi:trans-aconitate 2-methyltransferase